MNGPRSFPVSVLSLLRLRSPSDVADWYRIGAEYVRDVSVGMGFDLGEFDETTRTAHAALEADELDVPEAAARSIAADLFADAVFSAPFDTWMPGWYRVGLAVPVEFLDRLLRRIAVPYTRNLRHFSAPRFSSGSDVFVDGTPAHRRVDGFHSTFVLATAILHLEWYAYVAEHSGIAVPDSLVRRCREESVRYYAGGATSLSPDVRRFQRLLFRDAEWVARIDRAYELDSALFALWERQLRRAHRALRA